jgi:DNA repair exonuclease SbcCD ATPase subunit
MLISEISIKGFKSYGNNEQVLKLNTEKGELALIAAPNASGKSALLSSFEYTLYGKVRGRKRKFATLATLPNRINGELLNKIKFNSNGTEVEVHRGIGPNILKLFENGVENNRAGKSNLDEKIINYIGIDLETYNSFISMSINDFKNFISLTSEEKQILLDKLFNLDIINDLNLILKELNASNKKQLIKYDSEINSFNESLDSIKRSIDKSLQTEKINIQLEIDEINKNINSKKEEYLSLKDKIDKIKIKEKELKTDLDKEKEQYINIQNDIKNCQKEIDLYNSGKCFTCGTSFESDHFESLKSILLDKKKKVEEIKLEVELNLKTLREKQIKLNDISDKANSSFNDLTYLMKSYKEQISKLEKQKITSISKNTSIVEFENTIKEIEDKKKISEDSSISSKEKEVYYKELQKILGEDGVKKNIISNIINPINKFIDENLKKIGLQYTVVLDETFTAEIKHLNEVIDHDTLSSGENKMINIIILIAYLKLIRTKKHINVLFLDEVFATIDVDNIQKILDLFKIFAIDYKINIFLIHHAVLNKESFDRIIHIEKEVFSYIKEEKI